MTQRCAIFPLPACVALPGHTVPLHIFEPRYRRMVTDCEEQGLLLGVALGEPYTHAKHANVMLSQEDKLKSNLESYQPYNVFGAGVVRIVQRLPDGRFLIELDVKKRVRLVEFVQRIPYMIAEVEEWDYERHGPLERLSRARRIMELSDAILGDEAVKFRSLTPWTEQSGDELERLVFSVMRWLRVGPTATQALLECRSDLSLADTVVEWLELCSDALTTTKGGKSEDRGAAFAKPERRFVRKVKTAQEASAAQGKILRFPGIPEL